MKNIGMPGIGGSLGQCSVCGNTFLLEIMKNEGVNSFTMTAFPDQMMHCHDKCKKILEKIFNGDKDWHSLPDGPIRKEFERVTGEEKL